MEVRSFEVYGVTIEVHAHARRVWPPGFKRFINEKLANGEITVNRVMKTCNVSQSLVYKWRGDVRPAQSRTRHQAEERIFSQIIVENDDVAEASSFEEGDIQIRNGNLEGNLPASYLVDDLAHLLQALKAYP